MRYSELFEMSRSEARAIWLQHGVDPDAVENLKAAYRQLVLANHPDHGGTVSSMSHINAAYDVLRRTRQEKPRVGQPRTRNWYAPWSQERKSSLDIIV